MLRWLRSRIEAWWRRPVQAEPASAPVAPARLERVILTDGVAQTLFDDFEEHRGTERGEEEIGWVLMGIRQPGKALVLAALPAGTQRDAGVAHVMFDSDTQALASRILRQNDKRLAILGVVHTHPGSLRRPSGGDFQGDSIWVRQLRGEGIFGIGTADARAGEDHDDHRQVRGGLCFSWYALAQGDADYRPLPVLVAAGTDLAQPLLPLWHVLESYARPLNRLCRQLTGVRFELLDVEEAPMLAAAIPLSEPNQQLRLLLNEQDARYYWNEEGKMIAIDPHEPQLERAVYLILAELVKDNCESSTLIES